MIAEALPTLTAFQLTTNNMLTSLVVFLFLVASAAMAWQYRDFLRSKFTKTESDTDPVPNPINTKTQPLQPVQEVEIKGYTAAEVQKVRLVFTFEDVLKATWYVLVSYVTICLLLGLLFLAVMLLLSSHL